MEYELCKRLKEAGFPQETEFVWFWTTTDEKDKKVYERLLLEDEHKYDCVLEAAAPNLSELIEACPKGFSLNVHKLHPTYGITYRPRVSAKGVCFGPFGSPEEAVANLYLSLTKPI